MLPYSSCGFILAHPPAHLAFSSADRHTANARSAVLYAALLFVWFHPRPPHLTFSSADRHTTTLALYCTLCVLTRRVVSSSPTHPRPRFVQTYNTKFSETPGGVEYFDVYMGPITHRYSEVFWTSLPETPVPPEIVERFKGKGMVSPHFSTPQHRLFLHRSSPSPSSPLLPGIVTVPLTHFPSHAPSSFFLFSFNTLL